MEYLAKFLVEKYSPSQTRDSSGKWSTEASAASAKAKQTGTAKDHFRAASLHDKAAKAHAKLIVTRGTAANLDQSKFHTPAEYRQASHIAELHWRAVMRHDKAAANHRSVAEALQLANPSLGRRLEGHLRNIARVAIPVAVGGLIAHRGLQAAYHLKSRMYSK